jgi:uncharacterized protein YjbI with pentapeptide repeats
VTVGKDGLSISHSNPEAGMAWQRNVKVPTPTAAQHRTVTLDRKKFIPALVKVVLNAIPVGFGLATGVPTPGLLDSALSKMGPHIVDLVASFGLKSSPEGLASQLIFTAASKAAFELVRETSRGNIEDRSHEAPIAELYAILMQSDAKDLTVMLEQVLTTASINIGRHFFENPAKVLPLDAIASVLAHWLGKLGIPQPQTQEISNRFERYFVYAVYDEWQANPKSYDPLLMVLECPLNSALEKYMAWERYWAHLRLQVQLPMMTEFFGLDAVYVPLRAYFVSKTCPHDECEDARAALQLGIKDNKIIITQHVVDLDNAVHDWLAMDDKDDAIRLVCGGPGSGKSSFAKMLASDLAQKDQCLVFVPLARQKPDKAIKEIIGGFLQESGLLPFNPMDDHDKPLLLILDGLDELTIQGRSGAEAAKRLLEDVVRTTEIANNDRLRLRCLITGRDLSVQAVEQTFHLDASTLHVLPYCIDEMKEMPNPNDPKRLLGKDQRDDWWRKYGQVSGQSFYGMPKALRQDRLREMSGQPLLNYLLAAIYTQDFQDFADARLPTIYERLLSGVYKRDYGKPHPALDELTREKFFFALENIAVAIWHGDGRTANLVELRAHCSSPYLLRLLERVLGGLDQGLMRLLTAFYFRQALQRGESETFEFTHKSFGEYLTARNIVATLARLYEDFLRSETDLRSTWTSISALEDWLSLCGPQSMDEYLFKFIQELIAEKPVDLICNWQQLCTRLLGIVLSQGMPMGPRPQSLSFKTQCQQARNAELALLAVHCACTQLTKTVSKINWSSPTGLHEWMSWLEPAADPTLARRSLAYQDLDQQDLSGIILTGANLEGAVLTGANLGGASFECANLMGATLSGAGLLDADLRGAKLMGANLGGAVLVRTKLMRANLGGAYLVRAVLIEVNLRGADLRGADLGGADLREANLSGTNLGEAHIEITKVSNRSLLQAKFVDSALKEALRTDVDISHLKSYRIGKPARGQARALAALVN